PRELRVHLAELGARATHSHLELADAGPQRDEPRVRIALELRRVRGARLLRQPLELALLAEEPLHLRVLVAEPLGPRLAELAAHVHDRRLVGLRVLELPLEQRRFLAQTLPRVLELELRALERRAELCPARVELGARREMLLRVLRQALDVLALELLELLLHPPELFLALLHARRKEVDLRLDHVDRLLNLGVEEVLHVAVEEPRRVLGALVNEGPDVGRL